MPKINFITDFVFKKLNFKAFWRTTREPEFCSIWGLMDKISFCFRLFPGKTNDKIFQGTQEALFWGNFGSIFSKSGQK